ncbi:MAG: NAD(+) synthase, partial [Bacteroidales bacterium]
LNDKLPIDQVYDILIAKIGDYFKKAGKQRAVVGLSGGIDSAVVMALACKALGTDNVHGILMPSQFSTVQSVSDAVDLADNLNAKYDIIPIEKIYGKFMSEMESYFKFGEWSVAQENLQARIRGTILMTYSNKFDALLLNTSNKSELCTGYGTLYGDLCGSIMVIADLYKVQVYELANYINTDDNVIPAAIMQKAPSAELHPGQKDSDSLPVYDQLDPILYALNEEGKSVDRLISEGADKVLLDRILRLMHGAAFKVHQLAPVITVSDKPVVPANKCL